jgi:zinc protease
MSRLRLALTLLLLGSAMISTRSDAAEPQKVTSVEGISEFRLDNGLRVLLFPDPSKPQVTVNLTVFVGSRHEGYGEAGMAHLLEHMLFKGTPDHPAIPKALKDHGAEFNGTTWLDRTNYFETLPASDENLEFAIRLEADRMVNSYVKGEDLKSEMTVVRNEFERGENSPSRVLDQRIMSAAFEWHNYGKSTIGNRADIERVPINSLQRFYKRFYQPDNAMLIIAGEFDETKALALANKYFGAIPKPDRVLEDTYTEEPAQDGERRVTLRRVGDVPTVGVLYHICSGPHPDYVPIDVLEHIVTSSPSGRLYKSLVETKRCSSVSGAAYALHDPGIFKVTAEVAAGNDPNDVLTTIVETLESIGEKGVTDEEVERAKRYWLKNWESTLNDSAQLAVQLSEWAAQGDWRLMYLYRDRLEKVTAADVKAVAAKYLQKNNRTVGIFTPSEQSERTTIPQTPELAAMIGDYKGREMIAQGESFDVSADNIEKRTTRTKLEGGLKAALLPKKTRGEAVNVVLRLRFGSAESLRGKTAACEVLPALMLRGTKSLTRQQIQDILDQNKAQLAPSGGVGEASFAIETRRQNLPAVLELLRQILREPTLPGDELEIIRNRKLTALQQQLTDPQSLARVAVSRHLGKYPPDDVRYVPTVQEEIERWKALQLGEVEGLYKGFLNGQYGEVAIVGDFDADEAVPQLNKILADWKTSEKYERIKRPGNVEIGADIVEQVETPDKENAVYFGGTVIPMGDAAPDYPAILIANQVLGSSGLSSRLGDRIRQREGLSYGVGSILRPSSLDERSTFLLYAITNPVNMPKVEIAMKEEIEKLVAEGITATELEAAQKGYLESLKVTRASDGELVSTLADTLNADRTMEYYSKLEKAVQGLSTEVVADAVKNRLIWKRIAVVEAGDFAKAKKDAQSEGAEAGSGKK